MERALQVKTSLISFMEQFSEDKTAPGSLSEEEWTIIEIVVEIVRRFKYGADILEKHKSASGVNVVALIESLLLTKRMLLPGSEANEQVLATLSCMKEDNVWNSLRGKIQKEAKQDELFMFIRYLWSGKLKFS